MVLVSSGCQILSHFYVNWIINRSPGRREYPIIVMVTNMNLLKPFSDWFARQIRHDHEVTFASDIEEIERFKKFLKTLPCPACKQKTLEALSFSKDSQTWEADIECSNCEFKGVVNSYGFAYTSVNSQGKAVSK